MMWNSIYPQGDSNSVITTGRTTWQISNYINGLKTTDIFMRRQPQKGAINIKSDSKKLLSMLLTLCMVLLLVPFTVDLTVIDRADFTFTKPSYNVGEISKILAIATSSNAHYTIYDELIKEVSYYSGCQQAYADRCLQLRWMQHQFRDQGDGQHEFGQRYEAW